GTYQLADIPINAWADQMEYSPHFTVTSWVANMLDHWGPLLGGSSCLVASMVLVAWSWKNRRNRPEVFFALGTLLGIIVVWVAFFPNHVVLHDYQALFAAPVVCIGLGVTLMAGSKFLNGTFRWLVILIVPLILI